MQTCGDGPLLNTDRAACEEVARDMGNLVSFMPRAVVRPASIADVVQTVRFCQREGLPLVARGQAHTAFGQSQVAGGVVLDMRSLSRVHALDSSWITVDAGITWRNLLAESVPRGWTPAVLTAFQGLSVGGTLSVGGLSGASYKRGAQIDHVISLEVVTGDGRLVTCSRETQRALYDCVLGGLGQCAIIVRATLRLVAAPECVQHSVITYADGAEFLRDLRALAAREELDGVSGTIHPAASGSRYELNAFSFHGRSESPAMDQRLRGLAATTRQDTQHEYLDYYLQVDHLIDQLQTAQSWQGRAHPWFDAFIPEHRVDAWLSEVVPLLDEQDVGPVELGALGQVHLFPLRRRWLQQPLLRVPDGEWVYLFDILSSAHRHSGASYAPRMLERNRRLYERARDFGGSVYPIAAVPLEPSDWKAHFGDAYAGFRQQKDRHDPLHLLTPTPHIFSREDKPRANDSCAEH
jgi:cytokinin dehydrogenase